MAEALRVGIAGLGTVGASVVGVVTGKAAELTRQCGRELAVAAVSARMGPERQKEIVDSIVATFRSPRDG